jgi:hypothetical protein
MLVACRLHDPEGEGRIDEAQFVHGLLDELIAMREDEGPTPTPLDQEGKDNGFARPCGQHEQGPVDPTRHGGEQGRHGFVLVGPRGETERGWWRRHSFHHARSQRRGHPAGRRRAQEPHRSLLPSVPQVTPVRNGACLDLTDCLPRHRKAWTRSVCPIAAARPSRRGAWSLEPCPRQALGVRVWEAAVDDHDRDTLRPGLALVRRHREDLSSRRC